MPLRGFIAAFVLGVLATRAYAADPIGYAEAFDTLYSVDLVTHAATEIGRATPLESPTRYANITGLTFNPGGVLYAISDAGQTKTLLTIDRNTGLATPVGTLNLGTSQQLDLSLAFTCDGVLWMAAGKGKLYAAGGQGNNNLYVIDPAAVTATPAGSYGSSVYITTTSLAFDKSGRIWAVLDYVPPQSDSQPVKQWSDLAQLAANGALSNLGSITPATSASTADLEYIGLKGLAIPSGICAVTAALGTTPLLSWPAMAMLIAAFALLGGTTLRRRHQTP
jgi:hypothetical protein